MFEIRLLNNDYSELTKWWEWFRFPTPAQEMLPENGNGGLMVFKDGINICAGFVYFTNSKIAWVEYIISNPDYKEKNRKDAIKYLIESLSMLIENKGYKAIFTSVKNENLIQSFLETGFTKAMNNTTEMVLRL